MYFFKFKITSGLRLTCERTIHINIKPCHLCQLYKLARILSEFTKRSLTCVSRLRIISPAVRKSYICIKVAHSLEL